MMLSSSKVKSLIKRDYELDRDSLAGRGINTDLAPDLSRPLADVFQVVAVCGKLQGGALRCKALHVVVDDAPQLIAGNRQTQADRVTIGVPSDVVDGLLEDQKDAAHRDRDR